MLTAPVIRVAPATAERFAVDVLGAAGVRADVAAHVARGLVETSVRGVDSHGVRLLPHYVAGAEGGRINRNPQYQFERTTAATGVFDADHTYGHAACIEGMRRAMELARDAGVGWVAIRHSSHAGAAACAALDAARHDFIGFTFLNADALVRSPGSTRAFFGTNPFCMAAPCEGEEPFCFDSAPTRISFNKVRQFREENAEVPEGTCADANGDETRDPHRATQLLPIGDYKGFGLAMVMDVLCGLLTGMPAGRDISEMFGAPMSQRRNLGQVVIALDVAAFQPLDGFKRRMRALMDAVRQEPRKREDVPVMVPNDPEKRAAAERGQLGIPMRPHEYQAWAELGAKYGIAWNVEAGRDV